MRFFLLANRIAYHGVISYVLPKSKVLSCGIFYFFKAENHDKNSRVDFVRSAATRHMFVNLRAAVRSKAIIDNWLEQLARDALFAPHARLILRTISSERKKETTDVVTRESSRSPEINRQSLNRDIRYFGFFITQRKSAIYIRITYQIKSETSCVTSVSDMSLCHFKICNMGRKRQSK